MPTLILDRYLHLTSQGRIERDPAQTAAIGKLDELRERVAADSLAHKSSALGWLFGASRSEVPTRGMYLWGLVGRGKTMLMDLFFEAAGIARKRRVHFHAFMEDVHARIHAWRQRKKAGAVTGEEPVGQVATALAQETRLLCLDEFSVTNIADAMILGRLFHALFTHGVVVVATSNAAPDELYKDGLNRALFLPFVALIKERMDVLKLEARTDFRLEKLSGDPVYCVPADATAKQALDRTFRNLTGRDHGDPVTLDVLGHELVVPEAADGVARFAFSDLCDRALGASDYLAIGRRFHTIIVDGIPVIRPEERDRAQRFITLIDTLYDRHVKLVASAAAEPPALYTGGEGREGAEFRRTVSRLADMRSKEYLAMPPGHAELAGGAVSGIAET